MEPLRRFANLDNPPRVMKAICRSLGQIGGGAALKPIETIFLQGTPETRVECLDAAARVGSPSTKPLFDRALTDPRPSVSKVAAKHLRAMTAAKNPSPAKAASPKD